MKYIWRGRSVTSRELAALQLVEEKGALSHRGKSRWYPWGAADRWATWRTVERLVNRGELVWALPRMLVVLPEQLSAFQHINPDSAWLAAQRVVEAINLACSEWKATRWRPSDPVPWARVYVNDWSRPDERVVAKLWVRWDGKVTTLMTSMTEAARRRLRAALLLIGQRACV